MGKRVLSLADKEFILSDYEVLEASIVYKIKLQDKEIYRYKKKI